MNEKIRIGFIDFIPPLEKFFTTVLSVRYDVEIDNQNPQFLFFSVEDFGRNNRIFDSRSDVVKILYTGENRRPENYNCHYAITFDHNYNKWHYRLPLYVISNFTYKYYEGYEEYPLNYLLTPRNRNSEKEYFAGFVVKNGGQDIRNRFFHYLNSYKPVASGGPLFNNIGHVLPDIRSKIQFFNKCKFAICFENGSYPGYATEKLYETLMSNAIPIYWGSPTIDRDFNPNAFLDLNKFGGDFEKLLNAIKEIDNNDELYQKMLNEPAFTCNLPNECMIYDNFLNWFDSIVFKKKYMR